MWLHTASIRSSVRNKTRLFPRLFHLSTNSRLILAGAFRNDYLAACSTALRSATEENELSGYVTVPCPSKVTQHSSTAYWVKNYWHHQISYDGTHPENLYTFEVTLCINN